MRQVDAALPSFHVIDNRFIFFHSNASFISLMCMLLWSIKLSIYLSIYLATLDGASTLPPSLPLWYHLSVFDGRVSG